MRTLACRVCGRVVHTTAGLDTLFAEERRCPRCGSIMSVERRVNSRRKRERRVDRPDVPGPPGGFERRTRERRTVIRRRDEAKQP